VLQVVFSLQNQHPLSEPTPGVFFAIWAGFAVFGLFSTYLIIGGSAAGRPANDDTLLRKAWIYSLFIKANTHSQAHSRWLGGACDKSRTSHRECVDFVEIDNYNNKKKPHPTGTA
ncbi:MAG: hypothetical protein II231_02245, partial [Rikenellaceae bacterium]|nr:hypothetical protein [Rikenellaceae bacterium]